MVYSLHDLTAQVSGNAIDHVGHSGGGNDGFAKLPSMTFHWQSMWVLFCKEAGSLMHAHCVWEMGHRACNATADPGP